MLLVQLKVKNAHFLELCVPRSCGLYLGTLQQLVQNVSIMVLSRLMNTRAQETSVRRERVPPQACVVHKVLGYGLRSG